MPQVHRGEVLHRDSLQFFAKALWIGLIIPAVILSIRRSLGLFSETLPDVAACAATTFAVLIGLSAHLLFWSSGSSRRERNPHLFTGVITLVPPFAIGLALQPNPTTAATAYSITLFFTAATVIFILGSTTASPSQMHAQRSNVSEPQRQETIILPTTDTQQADSGNTRIHSIPAIEAGRNVLQCIKRTGANGSQESIEGEVTVPFAPGQRRAFVHVPFSPPLSVKPQIDCRILEGTLLRLQVAAAYPYGTRIEIRRTGSSDEAEEVRIGFQAVTAGLHSKAA